MKPKINYHYTISFKEVNSFEFIKYNNIVDETCYQHRVIPHFNKIVNNLKFSPSSRQEVIVTNNMKNNACLISLQFQIIKQKLIVIANFRSQCKINGRPNDTKMLRYFATSVMKDLKLSKFKIFVNAGNYHVNV